jgi:hypothetical protein
MNPPPAVLGRLDRGQAHTPARWKRFSLPLAEKVAKQFVEAFRDAYGDALCLSAYYRDAEPSIRRAEVLASRTSQRSLRGDENAGDVRGRLVYGSSVEKSLASTYPLLCFWIVLAVV